MQRARTKLKKITARPISNIFMSMVGLRPKQFVDQHDYHEMEQGKVTHENDMYINLYSTIEQQIRVDAFI